MKNRAMKLAVAGLVALAILPLSAAQAQQSPSGGFVLVDIHRIDALACRIQNDASKLCWELHHHFQHVPHYHTVYREAYEMYTTSRYIHELAHHHGRLGSIQRSVRELDQLFHHLQGHFRDFSRFVRHDFHGHQSIDHLGHAVNRMGITLHQLHGDLSPVKVSASVPATRPNVYSGGTTTWTIPTFGFKFGQ